MLGLWDIYQRELHTGSRTSLRGMYLAGGKAVMAEIFKPFDIRHGVSGFGVCLLSFSFALVLYFFTGPHLFPFGMVMYILCQFMLEVYNFFWILQDVTIKRLI